MEKTTFRRILLSLIVCLVTALSCFVITLIPKPTVAVEEKTVTAGVDFTLSGTPTDGVSITAEKKHNAVNEPKFMAGTYASPKIDIKNFSRMRATVVNFTESVNLNDYDTFSLTFSMNASNFNVIFEFYPNVSGIVVGQSDNAGSYASGAAAAGTQLALSIDLRPFDDGSGSVSSFILVHATDNRSLGDYSDLAVSFYSGTLSKAAAVSSIEPSVGYVINNLSLTENAEGVTYPSDYGTNGTKYYVNAFKRLCATVVYLTQPVYSRDVYSLKIRFSKAMGNQTQFDFYPNVESTVVGDLSYSRHTAVSTAGNGVEDTTTVRVADLADSYGKISSFIIVHTTDNRGDDYEMTFNIFSFTATSVAEATADNVLAIDGEDMKNGTSNASTNVDFIVATGAGKMYANNLLKGYAATVKFGTPIDVNLWKTLELRLNIMGLSNKYTFYLDLFKSGATDFDHNSATARYTVLNSRDNSEDNAFVSALVIELKDFADEKGLVNGITIVNYDNSGENLNAGNLSVYESYLYTESIADYEINGGEYTKSMPEKTDKKKVFIGWDIGGTLYAPFELYAGETATASPVYIDFYMDDGASVRVDEPTGLRYTSNVSVETDEYLKTVAKSYNYYTWFTSPGSSAQLKVQRTGSYVENGDFFKFNGVMVGISEADYARTFIGRSYVEISYESGRIVRFLSVGSHVERSVSYVAQQAIDSGLFADDAEYLAILKKFAGIE